MRLHFLPTCFPILLLVVLGCAVEQNNFEIKGETSLTSVNATRKYRIPDATYERIQWKIRGVEETFCEDKEECSVHFKESGTWSIEVRAWQTVSGEFLLNSEAKKYHEQVFVTVQRATASLSSSGTASYSDPTATYSGTVQNLSSDCYAEDVTMTVDLTNSSSVVTQVSYSFGSLSPNESKSSGTQTSSVASQNSISEPSFSGYYSLCN